MIKHAGLTLFDVKGAADSRYPRESLTRTSLNQLYLCLYFCNCHGIYCPKQQSSPPFFYVLFDIIPLYWRLGGCDDAKAVPAIMEALFFPLFQTIIFDFSKYQSLN